MEILEGLRLLSSNIVVFGLIVQLLLDLGLIHSLTRDTPGVASEIAPFVGETTLKASKLVYIYLFLELFHSEW